MSTPNTAVEIPAKLVKELRERTGAGFSDCRAALVEASGSIEKAIEILRKKGQAAAAKKATREATEGLVGSYIHAGGKIGVLVEVNCESDFVARTDDFKELVHDIAMHIAASDPKFIRREDVTPEAYEREKEIYRAQAKATGKPDNVVERIVEGRWGSSTRRSVSTSSPSSRTRPSTSRSSSPLKSASWARTSPCAALPASRWATPARPSPSARVNRRVNSFEFQVAGFRVSRFQGFKVSKFLSKRF